LGGKWKLNDFAILSGAYGFGFGNEKTLRKNGVPVYLAESADWFKAGVVLADSSGWKANAYYILTDPGDLQISGVEGEVSYPVLDFLTVGVNGTRDLTVISATQAEWTDSSDDFCSGSGTVTVTVTDSASGTATATIDVTSPG
jgi:hypothetical protein